MSGLQGYSSPLTPLMIQSPLSARMTPSSVEISKASPKTIRTSLTCNHSGQLRSIKSCCMMGFHRHASTTTGFFRNFIGSPILTLMRYHRGHGSLVATAIHRLGLYKTSYEFRSVPNNGRSPSLVVRHPDASRHRLGSP